MSHVDILLPHIIIYTPALPVSSFAAEGSIYQNHDSRKAIYTLKELANGKDEKAKRQNSRRLFQIIKSIKSVGIQAPLGTKLLSSGEYEIITGCMRLSVAFALGMKTVPAFVNCWTGQNHIPKGIQIHNTVELEQYFYAGEHQRVHYLPDGCISMGAGHKIERLLYDWDWQKLGRTE